MDSVYTQGSRGREVCPDCREVLRGRGQGQGGADQPGRKVLRALSGT